MSISWFLAVIVIIGLVVWLIAVYPRRKNILITSAAFIVWLGIFFWWMIGDIFTGMGMTGDYVDLFYYVPLVVALVAPIEYIIRANQVEIRRTIGGQTWSDFGTPPKTYVSNYDKYKAELLMRTRR